MNQTLPIATKPKNQRSKGLLLHVLGELDPCKGSFTLQVFIFDRNLPFEAKSLRFTDILVKFTNVTVLKIQDKLQLEQNIQKTEPPSNPSWIFNSKVKLKQNPKFLSPINPSGSISLVLYALLTSNKTKEKSSTKPSWYISKKELQYEWSNQKVCFFVDIREGWSWRDNKKKRKRSMG